MVSLIALPIVDITAPPLGIAKIKGFLKSNERAKIHLFDSGLDFFYYCLDSTRLTIGKNTIHDYITSHNCTYSDENEIKKYHHFFECYIDSEYVLKNVKTSVQLLKNINTYSTWSKYEKQLSIISRALRIASAPFFPTVITYQRIAFTIDIYNYKDVILLLEDKSKNPLISFFEEKLDTYITTNTKFIGISINYSQQIIAALTLANIIKKHNCNITIIAGGSFFRSFVSEPQIYNYFIDYFDAVIPDAGETVWNNIIKRNSIKNIGGCWISNGKKYVRLVENNRHIERHIPCFEDFELEKYISPVVILPYTMSTGCYWGKCAFCSYPTYKSDYIEVSCSSEKHKVIFQELVYLHEKYNASAFFITDEAIPPILAKKLALEIEQLNQKFLWFGEMRFEKILENTLLVKQLRAGGLELVLWGLESGCDRILKLMNKGTKCKTINLVLKNFRNNNIKSMPMMFFGFPTETQQEALQTIDLLKRNLSNIQYLGAGTFSLLKGSPIHSNPNDFSIKINKIQSELSYFDDYSTKYGMNQSEATFMLDKMHLDSQLQKFFKSRIMTWAHLLFLPIEITECKQNKNIQNKYFITMTDNCSSMKSNYNWFNKCFDKNQHLYLFNTTTGEIYEIPFIFCDIVYKLRVKQNIGKLSTEYGKNINRFLEFLINRGMAVITND